MLQVRRVRDVPVAGLVASVVVAAVLLLPTLGAASYWFDEAFSLQGAGRSLGALLRLVQGREINMVLYYALLWVWTRVGQDETWVRLLSAAFVLASLPVLWTLARRLADVRIAAIACLVLAANALAIRYGQEARSYALLLFLATTSTWLLVRALDQGRRRDWVLYSIAAVLVPYAQVLGGCLLAAHAVIVLGWRPRPPVRSLILPAAVVIAGTIPIAYLALLAAGTAVPWVPALSLARIVDVALDLAGAGRPGRAAGPWGWAALVAVLVGLGLGLWQWRRRPRPASAAGSGDQVADDPAAGADRADAGRRRRHGLLLVATAWAFVPLVAVIGLSVVKPVLISRYLIVTLPGIALLVAIGLHAIRPRWLGGIAAGVLIGLLLVGSGRYLADPGKPDWRGVTSAIRSSASPDDRLVVVESWTWRPLALYAELQGEDGFPELLFEDRSGQILDAVDPDYTEDLRELAGPLADEGRSVWIVSTASSRIGQVDGDDELFAGLRTRYRAAEVTRFRGITLTRMDPVGRR